MDLGRRAALVRLGAASGPALGCLALAAFAVVEGGAGSDLWIGLSVLSLVLGGLLLLPLAIDAAPGRDRRAATIAIGVVAAVAGLLTAIGGGLFFLPGAALVVVAGALEDRPLGERGRRRTRTLLAVCAVAVVGGVLVAVVAGLAA
jgi:hypothetical protein